MTEEDIAREEQLRDNPLESLGRQELDDQIKKFHADHFSQTNSVTVRELVIGARLARSKLFPKSGVIVGHCLPN
jgi:hypothetical protein